MGVRKFQVYHGDSTFEVDCKIEDGFKGFQLQLHSLTSLVPDEQTIFVEDYGWPVSQDRDLISAPDKLRVVARGKFIISDEQFARTLQKFFLTRSAGEEYRGSFDEELQPYIRQVLMYEDKEKQKKARETVPVARLEHESVAVLIRAGGCRPSQIELEHVFLLQLLFWFKQSFRDICSKITPVQLDSGQLKLLKTKEWRYANYFMLYCRAFGYESRLLVLITSIEMIRSESYLDNLS
ncbi:peptide-N(4)-(N-acetyl-beta-glucosaminyl)asparagine amidase-like [Carica papaya]|uniref:peptide-N(4)-(N-acetyl-beta- glucosaminyl)asparagine amidase-like n=1 Tax=Carica papaya TaxID=3649 RepID=UPI000B8CA8E3|nr:peptide-N(4)-(N-acetyl-beta-glucosaminyl)asparagine amidase-like [Carica papaya]